MRRCSKSGAVSRLCSRAITASIRMGRQFVCASASIRWKAVQSAGEQSGYSTPQSVGTGCAAVCWEACAWCAVERVLRGVRLRCVVDGAWCANCGCGAWRRGGVGEAVSVVVRRMYLRCLGAR